MKKWFDGNFARKTNLRGFNSYVAQKPYEEYQVDLFFMPESDGEEYRQALIMIDIFSKFMTVVPLKEKQAVPVLEAIKEGISNMGRKPEVIYSDDEGSFNSKQAQEYYDKENIKHLITRGHAPVAERAVRTIKNMLYKRMEAKPDLNWYDVDVLSNALTTYNYRNTHTSINITERCQEGLQHHDGEDEAGGESGAEPEISKHRGGRRGPNLHQTQELRQEAGARLERDQA